MVMYLMHTSILCKIFYFCLPKLSFTLFKYWAFVDNFTKFIIGNNLKIVCGDVSMIFIQKLWIPKGGGCLAKILPSPTELNILLGT